MSTATVARPWPATRRTGRTVRILQLIWAVVKAVVVINLGSCEHHAYRLQLKNSGRRPCAGLKVLRLHISVERGGVLHVLHAVQGGKAT